MYVSPRGSGTIKVNQTESSSYPAIFDIENGKSVRIEANPALGYQFSHWEGHLVGSENPATIVIDCDKNITAHFSQLMYTLTINVNGEGSTIPEAGEHRFAEGTEVNIRAIAGNGWQLEEWTGDINTSDEEAARVIMGSAKVIAANFSRVKTSWWFVGSITAGVLIMVSIIVLLIRSRIN